MWELIPNEFIHWLCDLIFMWSNLCCNSIQWQRHLPDEIMSDLPVRLLDSIPWFLYVLRRVKLYESGENNGSFCTLPFCLLLLVQLHVFNKKNTWEFLLRGNIQVCLTISLDELKSRMKNSSFTNLQWNTNLYRVLTLTKKCWFLFLNGYTCTIPALGICFSLLHITRHINYTNTKMI